MGKLRPLETLQTTLESSKAEIPKGETGISSVDTLYSLAVLFSRGELAKLPPIPAMNKVFEQAIADLNRDHVEQPIFWAHLFASAKTLLPANSWTEKLLDRIRKHVPDRPEATAETV